jgi:tRNA(Arg) A34 adenosine deaminase TadA
MGIMSGTHEDYMTIAIEEARAGAAAGEQPFGAVIVQDGSEPAVRGAGGMEQRS